jgi:integrase
MALYKRKAGGTWWVRFSSGGKTIRRSSGSTDREFAEEYETTLRARHLRQRKLGESVHYWSEAVERFKRESNWRDSTRAVNEYALGFFTRLDGFHVGAVNADVVRSVADYVARQQSPASANRLLAVFRGVLRACVRWGWLTHCPPVPMSHIPSREPAFIKPEQFRKLMDELPEHLRAPVAFSVLTGMRMANVRDLTWDRVNLENGHVWIPSSHYKTKRSQGLPLSTEAVALLTALPNRKGRVFLYDGEPITGTFNTKAFRKARARAGLASIRWHDLRHTFASWLATSGASDRVLQSMGGWTSPRMVSRYAHLRPSDLMSHADAVGTIMVTALRKTDDAEGEKDA